MDALPFSFSIPDDKAANHNDDDKPPELEELWCSHIPTGIVVAVEIIAGVKESEHQEGD